MYLTFTKPEGSGIYHITFNKIVVGELIMGHCGFYQYWPNENLTGCLDEWTLREIADKMKELNAEWATRLDKELGHGTENLT